MSLPAQSVGSLFFLVPRIYNQSVLFAQALPLLEEQWMQKIPADSNVRLVLSQMLAHAKVADPTLVIPTLVNVLNSVFGGFAQASMVLMFALYLLADGKRCFRWISDFFSAPTRLKMEATSDEASLLIAAYVRGQVFTSIVCFVVTYAFLKICGVPSALLLAAIAGATDVIPILGFFIGLIPAMMLAFTVNPTVGVVVTAGYIAYNAIENSLVLPYIYGASMKISSLVVLLSLFVAGEIGGVLGAIIALPVVASYPIIERIWLEKYIGHRTIEQHAIVSDEIVIPEQVRVWGESKVRSASSLPSAQRRWGRNRKILVVEDDPDIRMAFGSIFEAEGFTMIEASHGVEGLEALDLNPDIELIFLDVSMPVMDGNTFLATIKKVPRLSAIPVVFLSGSLDVADTRQAAAVLAKPARLESVIQVLTDNFRTANA